MMNNHVVDLYGLLIKDPLSLLNVRLNINSMLLLGANPKNCDLRKLWKAAGSF